MRTRTYTIPVCVQRKSLIRCRTFRTALAPCAQQTQNETPLAVRAFVMVETEPRRCFWDLWFYFRAYLI